MTMSASKFSSEDRLSRKRQAARIRQQRCRARKRALAAAAVAAAKTTNEAPTAKVILDGRQLAFKRKTQQQSKHIQIPPSQVPAYPSAPQVGLVSAPNDPHTTVDGVRMSKRAAVHAALLDEHNRKFFAQVAAERTNGGKKDEKMEGDRAPISHVVVKNNHVQSHKVSSVGTPTRTGSPIHPYYRHAYPASAYYPYPTYGPRPHDKYTAPPPLPHHHPGYPHSPPPPMFRPLYDGRYHPIPPHALPQPTRHFHATAPPQHSMMESSAATNTAAATVPAVVTHSVSDDDRSTPSQELSPAAGSDEEASYHSMDQKEQEAIAAMLTLSSASVDEEAENTSNKPTPHEQASKPLVMSQ